MKYEFMTSLLSFFIILIYFICTNIVIFIEERKENKCHEKHICYKLRITMRLLTLIR